MTLLKDTVQIEKGRKYNLLEENVMGLFAFFKRMISEMKKNHFLHLIGVEY